jgi:Protein of unknown function (DUF3078).
MRKYIGTFICIMLVFCAAKAQDDVKETVVTTATDVLTAATKLINDTTKKDKTWYIKNTLTLSTEQNMYDNWEAGGVGSFAFAMDYKGYYNYHYNKIKWDNTIELGYGKMRQDNNGKGIFDGGNKFRKSEDKMELNSIVGYKAYSHWNYSALLNFKSQFDDGYKNDSILISSFLAPAFITASMGMEYKPKPFMSVLISPVTGRLTYMHLDTLLSSSTYGYLEGKHTYFAFGSYIKFFFEKDVFKNINLLSKLEFFSDYNNDKFVKETDINFENYITMKVNKYFAAFINVQVAYNRDFSEKLQYKERIGLSVPLNF